MRKSWIALAVAVVFIATVACGSAPALAADPALRSDGASPPRGPAPQLPGETAAGQIVCQAKAGWADPYPSVIIIKQLIPACDAAEVQVIRTNGQAYPAQCVWYRGGKLTIGTATGDYHLAVGADSLTGEFVSKLNAGFSRSEVTWDCGAALATER